MDNPLIVMGYNRQVDENLEERTRE